MVAAGHAISDEAANTAVIAKMVRVMMLAPFLIVLSAYLSLWLIGGGIAINAGVTALFA